MGVLGLSTLSARANGKLGMTTVIEAGKKICNCCNALLSQVCEIIDVMVVGKEGRVNHCSEFVSSQSDSIVQKISRLTDRWSIPAELILAVWIMASSWTKSESPWTFRSIWWFQHCWHCLNIVRHWSFWGFTCELDDLSNDEINGGKIKTRLISVSIVVNDGTDEYIVMKCVFVCVTKKHHFLLGVFCNHFR